MNYFFSIILFFIFILPVKSVSSPTIIRSIETIQCWEDLKGADSDQDYSEPCEKVIEYMLLDSSDNLYGIARTARILQSGDEFATKVYFSVPMSKDHQQSAPEYTLGYLNYVTCDGEQIRNTTTGPSDVIFRTDTEGTTGDQGTNCLDGNSISEFLNTSGTITHSGRSNYFIWQPGRCVTFSNPIDPLNPAVRTKNDCVTAGGQWENFIPKETSTSPGWNLNYLSQIHNGHEFIYADDKNVNNSPLKIVSSTASWRATTEKNDINQISSGLAAYIQNHCQNSKCEHISRVDLDELESTNNTSFGEKRASPSLTFLGGKALQDFNISNASRHYSRKVELWDSANSLPKVNINTYSTQYCTETSSPFNGNCTADSNGFAFLYLQNALEAAQDHFDGGTSSIKSGNPGAEQLCPSEIPLPPKNPTSDGATIVMLDKDGGVYQGGMDTNNDGTINVVYGDSFTPNMADNGGSHHSDYRWYVNPATQNPWSPKRMNNVIWAYLVRQIVSGTSCPAYPDGENSVIVSGNGHHTLWVNGSGYLFANSTWSGVEKTVTQTEQVGWGMPPLLQGQSACYWTYITKYYFPRVRRPQNNIQACGWGYQCPNNSCDGSPTFPVGCKFFRTVDTTGNRSNTCWHHGSCGSAVFDSICYDQSDKPNTGSCVPYTYDTASNTAGWCMNDRTWHACKNPLGDGYASANGRNWTLPTNFQQCAESWVGKSGCQGMNMGGIWVTNGMKQDQNSPYFDFSNSCGVISEAAIFSN